MAKLTAAEARQEYRYLSYALSSYVIRGDAPAAATQREKIAALLAAYPKANVAPRSKAT